MQELKKLSKIVRVFLAIILIFENIKILNV